MGKKTDKRARPAKGGEAVQVFRQFAWNLAGTLKKSGGKSVPGGKRA